MTKRHNLNLIWMVMALTAALGQRATAAETLGFAPSVEQAGWTAISFFGITPALFKASRDGALEVSADTAAGLLWRPVNAQSRLARTARWRWQVDEGVGPTDLTRRGADDRSLSIYFVFNDSAGAGAPSNLMSALASPSVTALVFVFGGDKPRGTVLASPHMGKRGKFIVLRPADTRKGIAFDEKVDLAQDYLRAFGRKAPSIIAVAISTDSDDTRGRNRVRVQDFVLGE